MIRKAHNSEELNSSGPYSHAIDSGEYVYLSGQTSKNTSNFAKEDFDIKVQTEICLDGISKVLDTMGLTEKNIVKVNVYLTTMKNFEPMNEVYKTKFTEPYPARTCVAVFELPGGADIEIEVVAKK